MAAKTAGILAVGEEAGMAVAPEVAAPLLLAQAAPQIADVAKTAIPVVGDVAKTAIPVVGDVAKTAIPVAGDVAKTAIPVVGNVAVQATKSYEAVATEAIHQTPTVLSLPMKMMSMTVGVALIVIGVLLVLISIAVISAQSNKTAGIMIFIVGFLMAGGGGYFVAKASSLRRAQSKKA